MHDTHDPETLGVDEPFISELVDRFYGRVRSHARLGPIFDGAIEDRWDAHLDRMKKFWGAVVLRTRGYSGRPVPAHQKLAEVEPDHFQDWLALFRQTLEDLTNDPAIVALFTSRAERIAESLKLAMFGRAGVIPTQRFKVLS